MRVRNCSNKAPFSVVGEIGVYYYSVNFKKLMDKLNIDIYRMSNGKPTIWGHFQEPPQQEKEFSDKYINQMDKAMVDTIAGRRKIDVSQVESVKGKLLTAQKALDLGYRHTV
jgi:ClpP class serine protease